MDLRTFGLVLVIAVIVASLAMSVARRQLYPKIERRFMAGDYDGALKILDGWLARQAFPEYNLNYLRLNALEAKGDSEGEREVIEQMLRLKCTDEQRSVLLARALGFYISQRDQDADAEARAAHILELVESNGNEGLLRSARLQYEIAFKGSWSHIAEMEHELAGATPDRKAQLNYLLSLQYENKGDSARAEEYLRRSAANLGMPMEP